MDVLHGNPRSRRAFLRLTGLAVAACASGPDPMRANPIGLPIGLQLYTVGEQLGKDFTGTLQQIAAIGRRPSSWILPGNSAPAMWSRPSTRRPAWSRR